MPDVKHAPSSEECIKSFFDQQSPVQITRNLRSMLQKTVLSAQKHDSDASYLAEMMQTTDITCEFLMQIALLHNIDVFSE